MESKTTFAQPSDSSSTKPIFQMDNKSMLSIEKKLDLAQQVLDKQTNILLTKMQKQEEKLSRKLAAIDSLKAKEVFSQSSQHYEELKQLIIAPPQVSYEIAQSIKTYLPQLDSFQTALGFFQQKGNQLPVANLSQLQTVSNQLQKLQMKLQLSSRVQTFAADREQYLKEKLSSYGFGQKLTAFNKQVYYYHQRIEQVKGELEDKNKLKQQLINEAFKQPAFQKFWQKNSFLGRLFPMPDEADTSASKVLAQLQTKDQVSKLIEEKLDKPNISDKAKGDGQIYLAQQVQQAKSQMDVLKNKVRRLGLKGNSNDLVIPDFAPNSQKTKSFLKRIELGFNIQNTQSTSFLPAMSNVGVTAGYRFNDKITAGTGLAYLLGWGSPVKNIHFSNQGIGLRSYVDMKAKGSFWLSAGYEYNYMQAFANIRSIKNLDLWQKSALIGLSKKYKMGNKTGNIQLLYDVLAHQQIPITSPIKFRVGYSF